MSGTEPLLPAQVNGTERLWSALPSTSATEGVGIARLIDDDTVAGFRVGRLLGQGGMASVYEATHVASGQRVALKRVRADARQDPQFIERFLREVRAASRLDHPNICRVLAGGDDGKDVFMAVEILDGGDVEHLLQRAGGKLPAASAAEIVGQLLEALAHAHANGVVHRDIKPQNIMLSGEGVVKLVDFGIARSADDVRLTSTGLVVGTPAYMSPEQARGQPIDARSDLFSVGVVFAEMLTGKNPFAGENATATVMKILTETLMPLMAQDPTIPGVLSVVVEGLLQRDPARRYPSARAAADDLAAYRRLVALDHPNLLRRTLDDAVAAVVAQREQQAAFEAERANDLLALGETAWPAAALALYRASRLVPENAAVRVRFDDLCARAGFDFAPTVPKIVDVEATIARSPPQPALFKRAADLHRAAKNPLGTASWLLRYLQLQPSDELARRQLDVLHRGPAQTSSWPREKLSTREIVDGIKTGGGWKAATHKTETTFQPLDALLPAEKPKAQRPAKPLMGARVEPQVVVVNEVRGGVNVGSVIAASVVVVAVAAVVFLATRTKESLDEQERKRGAALVHHLDATPEMHVRAQDALARARAAVVARNGADAVDAADEALAFAQLDPDELLAAQFLKAEGYALSGDKASARLAVDDYLKRARLGHPDHAAAIALEGRLR